MTFTYKHVVLIVALSLFLLPGSSIASISDFEWGTEEGRRIAYTYRGESYNRVNVSGTVEIVQVIVEEDIFFEVDDLTNYPIPTIEGVSVTPHWYNWTPFENSDDQELGWYIDNIDLIDEVAVRVGDWSIYAELAQEYWDSRNPGEFIVSFSETSRFWNITLKAFSSGDYLVGVTLFSYDKEDGKLEHGYHKRCNGSEDALEMYLGLTIHNYNTGMGEITFILGSFAVVGIIAIIVLPKRMAERYPSESEEEPDPNHYRYPSESEEDKTEITRRDRVTPKLGCLCYVIGFMMVVSFIYDVITFQSIEFVQLLGVAIYGTLFLMIGIGLLRWNWKRGNC